MSRPTIRIDIRIDADENGMHSHLRLVDPSVDLLTYTIADLVANWMSGAEEPADQVPRPPAAQPIPAATPVPPTDETPAAPWTCELCPDQGFVSAQALGAHRRYHHPRVDQPVRSDDVVRYPHQAVLSSKQAAPPPAVAVPLCRCGHAERMHELDQELGRGACMHGSCGCTQLRLEA